MATCYYVTQKLKFGLGRVENMEGKGENARYHVFKTFPPQGRLNSGLCGKV